MISSRQAAEIARRHGLSLTDAAALSKLADSEEEGDELAQMFVDGSRQLPRKDAGGPNAAVNDWIRQQARSGSDAEEEDLNARIRSRARGRQQPKEGQS